MKKSNSYEKPKISKLIQTVFAWHSFKINCYISVEFSSKSNTVKNYKGNFRDIYSAD